MHGEYTGTIDRIVDGETAVLLIEADGEVIDQVDIPVTRLPEPTSEDGGIVSVTIESGDITMIEYLPEETQERRESIEDKLDRLSTRLSEE